MKDKFDYVQMYFDELNIPKELEQAYFSHENISNDIEIKINDLLNIDFSNLKDNKYEDYRDLIVLKAADHYLIIIAIVDRLAFMQANKKNDFPDKEKYAQISLNVYAPLAHRLGIYSIKTELEDLSLYYTNYNIYMNIVKSLEVKKDYRDRLINEMIDDIKKKLIGITDNFEIKGRSKSIYSIFKKMSEKDKTIEDIFDLYALRIICEDIVTCYTILGIIHNIYTPYEGRFKDYIAVKKPNLYQSLHTTVKGIDDKKFEIQIRTFEMDKIAENGVAAHYLYKEKKSKDSLVIKKVDNLKDVDEFDYIKNISEKRVYAYTPQKKIIQLPNGSTIVDFAYVIHTNVAKRMVGAKINGNIVKLNTKIKNGDVVEILVKNGVDAPSKEWLLYAHTERARKKINISLKQQVDAKYKEEIEEGESNLVQIFKDLKLDPQLLEIEKERNKILRNFSLNRISDLYRAVYENKITEEDIEQLYTEKKKEVKLVSYNTKENNELIHIPGADGIKKQIAKCCNPIPGDEICGIIVTGVGIKIHRKNCNNIMKNPTMNLVEAEFNSNSKEDKKKFESIIKIYSTEKNNSLVEIVNLINKQNVQINKVDSRPKDLQMITYINLYVTDTEQLNHIISTLRNVDQIIDVKRVMR